MQPDDELEAGRQFETLRHLARTDRRRIELRVTFHEDGRISTAAMIPLTEVPRADRHDKYTTRNPSPPAR